MPPKKNPKGKAPVTNKKSKEVGKDENKTEKKKQGPKLASTCRRPMATGTVMAQRRLPPTICCPAPGAAVRCCLPRPGCWPY